MFYDAIAAIAANLAAMTVDETNLGGLDVPRSALEWDDVHESPDTPNGIGPEHTRLFWLDYDTQELVPGTGESLADRESFDVELLLTVAYYGTDTARPRARGMAMDDAARIHGRLRMQAATGLISWPTGFYVIRLVCGAQRIETAADPEAGGFLLRIPVSLSYERDVT